MKITIGVLGVQGAVEEHRKAIEELGYTGVVVKHPKQLNYIDGLILPGGESTVMRKFIDVYGFFKPLVNFSRIQKPIFGTCAGMVLVAKELSGSKDAHLQLMDIQVKRNAFGRQRESFETSLTVKGLDKPYHAVFIRAPYIEKIESDVEVLAVYDDKIVAAKQNHILTCAFHPELTGDTRLLQLFVDMIKTYKGSVSRVG